MSDIRKREGAKGVTYQVRYPSNAAKSGYAYETFTTLKAARAFSQNIGQIDQSPGSRLPVGDAVDRWLGICERVGRDGREAVEPETLKEYKRRARIMKLYAWAKPIGALVPADIVAFRTWLLETYNRDVSRRTLSSFHSVLIEMKHQGLITSDPAAGITVKSGGRYEDEDSEVQIPTDKEMKAIFAAADRLAEKNRYMAERWARYRPMIYLAALSGMRPSEYRGLPWSNLSSDSVVVKQRADATGIIGPVKSKAGRRTIYLPRLVTDMISAWKDLCPASARDLVFPTESGQPQALTNFTAGAWTPLMKEAGLMVEVERNGKVTVKPKYTPYALRHYFASKLIERNRDLKYIQKMMGHSRIEITLNVYGHLIGGNEQTYKDAAEAIAFDILGKAARASGASKSDVKRAAKRAKNTVPA